ncbi:MAG: aminotransferase class I/II-fold pyridoxal phosphate-dependent enzyme [Spirochaetales bacterium]|nr:aminotransferase class I/II-fold pyridoxal phosphate-dependent enzyme [Spirochaetales bacterium]
MNSDNYSLSDFIEYNDRDIFKKTSFFYEYARDYISKKYFTYFRTLLSDCSPRVKILDRYTGKEKEMIMLASNNYLGLSSRPEVIEAGIHALEQYGSGLCGSPLLCGYSALHRRLEEALAGFKSSEDAMLFPTGFSTNIGTLTALLRKNDVVITDRLDHASIIDGALFSGAVFRTFGHNDLEKCERILKTYDKEGKLVIIEGVYSMDGDISPLPEIKKLCDTYGARLMVDEAHATGVLGKTGRGSIEHFNLEGQIDIVMGTFSKALGAMGGFICASKEVINYIRFYARSYFFSASLSPVIVASVLKSLEILVSEPQLIQKLRDNIGYMKSRLLDLGFNIGHSSSAIIPIFIGDDILLRKMAVDIHERGLFLNAVFYPAVPKGNSRIRLSLMATHSKDDLDEALKILEEVGKKYGVLS